MATAVPSSLLRLISADDDDVVFGGDDDDALDFEAVLSLRCLDAAITVCGISTFLPLVPSNVQLF
jgi:hypothetical protein